MTTQTLIGNFKGKGDTSKLMPVMLIAIINSLPLALIFALVTLLFPQSVFGLLTSHSEINREITQYTVWLLPLLSFTAIAFIKKLLA